MRINESNPVQLDTYIQQMATGNLDALEQLYQSTHSAIYAFALSILKNSSDAEDVVHDCYLNVLRASGNYQSYGKPLAWMLSITRNLCMDTLKKKERIQGSEVEDWMLVSDESNQNNQLLLQQYFEVLDDEEREIVVLHALTGLKFREIAQIVQKSLSTVLSKYNRSLKKLKKAIQERGLYEES